MQSVYRRYRFFNNLNGVTCNADPTMEHKFMNVLSEPEHSSDYASAMLQVRFLYTNYFGFFV